MPFVASLLLALAAGAVQPPAMASASAQPANAGRNGPDSTRREGHTPRRIALTPELERSAFADATARTLLARARVARLAQDSALRAYDAKTYQRLSVGMGFRRIGRDRLLMRIENASKVHWDRARGVTVEPTGRRAVFPLVKDAEADADIDDISPIPYFPGRETLWFPASDFGVAKAEVDDRAFVHPLAGGSEAYYRYATGDSQSVKLPDGRVVNLREMRITARRPDWHLFVGSFWFDVDRGQLVRAAYRMAVDMDIWQVADEEMQRDLTEAIERARTDTSAAAREAVRHAEHELKDDAPPGWVKGLITPMKAKLSTITVEYGLYEGRIWMPRRNIAEGEAQAGFLRVPVKIEESFKYDHVAADVPALDGRPPVRTAVAVADTTTSAAPHPALAAARTAVDSALARMPDDTTGSTQVTISIGDGPNGRTRTRTVTIDGEPAQLSRAQRVDSTLRAIMQRADSFQHVADSLDVAGDTAKAHAARARAASRLRRAGALARREVQCQSDSSYDAGTRRRFDGALRVHVRMPCDTARLSASADLPKSPYDPGEEVFSTADRDALVKALDLGLQPGWAPQPVQLHYGLDLMRYNRVEGLSVGASATSVLGAGYTAQGLLRLGAADLVPNAELSIARSDGRRTIRLGAFHRLGVANDDWGSPLNFGASVSALLYGRDEGFYYRTFGAELGGSREAPFFGATVDWRLFAERQRTAGVAPNTQLSLGRAIGNARFIDNIDAQQATVAGGAADLSRTFGEDPSGLRLFARTRVEGAAVRGATIAHGATTGYGRLMTEGTLSRAIGSISLALTGSAGGIAGEAPLQRQFYMGGIQTVRGQFARPSNEAGGVASGYQGNAFWLGRAEVGTSSIGARPVVFFDAGWAGPRELWNHPGRPLSGAGVGLSFMDGLVRTDLSRGIYPQKRVRFDLYVEARF
jgi:hypothetical protein